MKLRTAINMTQVWDRTPRLCVHGKRKSVRTTTVAFEGEKPEPHLLVEPTCGKMGCPSQLYPLPKNEAK